jgi:hypothetical protein
MLANFISPIFAKTLSSLKPSSCTESPSRTPHHLNNRYYPQRLGQVLLVAPPPFVFEAAWKVCVLLLAIAL